MPARDHLRLDKEADPANYHKHRTWKINLIIRFLEKVNQSKLSKQTLLPNSTLKIAIGLAVEESKSSFYPLLRPQMFWINPNVLGLPAPQIAFAFVVILLEIQLLSTLLIFVKYRKPICLLVLFVDIRLSKNIFTWWKTNCFEMVWELLNLNKMLKASLSIFIINEMSITFHNLLSIIILTISFRN